MFGYVTIYKDELKIKDYNTFRAYYCGLCKAMGKQASQVSRLGLSYDITFLAVLLSSVQPEEPVFVPGRCMLHPAEKKPIAENAWIDYAACMGVLLSYLKLEDDWQDERSIKALLGMLFLKPGVRRIKKQYGDVYEQIRSLLKRLSGLEKQNISNHDEVADCFAKILELLFAPRCIENEETKRILSWMGYNTGRWIYLVDAFADLEKDHKKQSYNPFLADYDGIGEDLKEYQQQLAKRLEAGLTYTLDNIASSYELLPVSHHDAILRNILYLSLKSQQDRILHIQGEKNK